MGLGSDSQYNEILRGLADLLGGHLMASLFLYNSCECDHAALHGRPRLRKLPRRYIFA